MSEKLAIHGGKPVRETPLPYGRHWVDEEDIQAVVDVLRSDWITMGPKIDEFEKAFCHYVGAQFGVAVSSGTAALHGAMFGLDIQPGDEVITTPMTFAATSNAVLYLGGTPVFADINLDGLQDLIIGNYGYYKESWYDEYMDLHSEYASRHE